MGAVVLVLIPLLCAPSLSITSLVFGPMRGVGFLQRDLPMSSLPNRIKFVGRVHPAGTKITGSAPDVTFVEGTGAFKAIFNVRIVDSAIDIQCDFDNALPDHPYHLWAQAQEICQTFVNVIAFQLGAGTVIVLDRWINERGETNDISFADPALPPLCTVFKGHDFNQITRIIFAEPGLFVALNDIVLANAMPRHVLINCARCVEALRHLLASSGTDRNQAWATMRQTLNVDQAYLTFITQHSVEPRHGRHTEVGNAAIPEVRARTWTLMNRFLYYRLHNNQPLPLNEFPLLVG